MLVVRHAAAEPRRDGVADRDRALSEQGRKEAQRLGELLAAQSLVPEVVVVSAARRASETAALIVSASGAARAAIEDERIYRGDDADLARVVRDAAGTARSVLMVGHEPSASALVARLAGEHGGLPPAGMAVLCGVSREWAELTGEGARMRLVALWRPGDATPADAPRAEADPRGKWIVAAGEESVADVARRSLDARFATLAAALVVAAERGRSDADVLRKARVAGRRVEAVLRVYRDFIPRRRRDRVMKALRRLRRATRPVRDADILRDRLSERATDPRVAMLLASLDSVKPDAQAALARARVELGDDGHTAGLVGEMVSALVRRAARSSGSIRVRDWAPLRYEELAARYRDAASSAASDAASLHELRLAGKKLRYEIELLAAVLPSAVRAEVYPMLVEMQDRLGVVSDQATRVARLEELVAELDPSHPRDALADVVATEHQALEAARTDFLAWRENASAEKWCQASFFEEK